MGICELCNVKKGDRIIAGMSICNECFTKLQGLRNGNEDDLLFLETLRMFLNFLKKRKNILMK